MWDKSWSKTYTFSDLSIFFASFFVVVTNYPHSSIQSLKLGTLKRVSSRSQSVVSYSCRQQHITKFNNSNYSSADMRADRISLHPVTESSIFFYIFVYSHRSVARKSLQVSTMWNAHFLIKWLRLNVTVKVTLKITTKTTRFQIICLIFFTRRCMRMCFENWHFQFYCLEFL